MGSSDLRDSTAVPAKAKLAIDRAMKRIGPGLYPGTMLGPWGQCRAPVRIYVNGAIGGNWTQCSKKAREGKKCCWWHRRLEDSPPAGE
jgi:hypothetical protein